MSKVLFDANFRVKLLSTVIIVVFNKSGTHIWDIFFQLPIPESPSSTTTTNGTSYNTLKSNKTQKPKAPPVPEKRSTLSFNQPPPCPTPDYDTLSIASTNSMPKLNGHLRNGHTDNVEMESLESFELYSHTGNKPKPPDIYFSKTSANGSISSGTSTLRKQRPVSVTIGEYGNGTLRKPGKLNFLQNGKDEMDERKRQTITSQFASELAQTLNRSNLKRRTESMVSHFLSVLCSVCSNLCCLLAVKTSQLLHVFVSSIVC